MVDISRFNFDAFECPHSMAYFSPFCDVSDITVSSSHYRVEEPEKLSDEFEYAQAFVGVV